MPFIGDEELDSLQRQIDISLEEKEEYEIKMAELEESASKIGKSSLMTNLFFGLLSGLGIGFALFLFLNGGSGSLNNVQFAKERKRIVDSIKLEYEDFSEDFEDDLIDDENPDDTEMITDTETAAEDIQDSLKNQKVYSVQIKAFTDNRHPVLSTSLAVIATRGNYYKYSIGVFNKLEEAHALRLELVRIGFKDAFVASYINGERQEIHKPE